MKSRLTLKHHFFSPFPRLNFTLDSSTQCTLCRGSSSFRKGLLVPVWVLPQLQGIHDLPWCGAFGLGIPHTTVSHSLCSLFLSLCHVFARSHTGFPGAATAPSVGLSPAHQSCLEPPRQDPPRTKLLELLKEKSSKWTRNPKQNAVALITHFQKRSSLQMEKPNIFLSFYF